MINQQPLAPLTGFNPDDFASGDICIIRYGLEGRTRAEFVRRTRNPDWFIVLRWNPYERRYARLPVRLHRRTRSRREHEPCRICSVDQLVPQCSSFR